MVSDLNWKGQIEAGQRFYVWGGMRLAKTKEEANRMWDSFFHFFSIVGFWASGAATVLLAYAVTSVTGPVLFSAVYCVVITGAAVGLGLYGSHCLGRIGKPYDSPAVVVVEGGRFKAKIQYTSSVGTAAAVS